MGVIKRWNGVCNIASDLCLQLRSGAEKERETLALGSKSRQQRFFAVTLKKAHSYLATNGDSGYVYRFARETRFVRVNVVKTRTRSMRTLSLERQQFRIFAKMVINSSAEFQVEDTSIIAAWRSAVWRAWCLRNKTKGTDGRWIPTTATTSISFFKQSKHLFDNLSE